MAFGVTDQYGLVNDNRYMVVFVPANARALPFRVISRHNRGGEVLPYGSIPIDAAEVWASYDGGTTTAPVDNVIPNRAYTSTGSPKKFTPLDDMTSVYDSSDMWYTSAEEFRTRLFHVYMDVFPRFIRCGVQIPTGQDQLRFQGNRVILGVGKSSGWTRGGLELVHFPELHYGYTFGNDLNIDVYNTVMFTYGEYVIGIPTDASLVFDILSGDKPAHWVEMPIASYDASIRAAFERNYGIEGFPLYAREDRQDAMSEYSGIIGKLKPEVRIERGKGATVK